MTMYFPTSSCDGSRPQAWLATCAAFLSLACSALPASAEQPASQRLVMLQSDDGHIDDALKNKVDEVVLRTLSQQAGFTGTYMSPVPFGDVELAAGCAGQESGCLQRIAATLQTDSLIVRELTQDESKRVFLTLIAHDGSDTLVTRRAVAELSNEAQTPEKMVPLLVERLYPARMAHASAAPRATPPAKERSSTPAHRKPADHRSTVVKVVGWSSAATGGALLAAGVVVGALSKRDQRAYDGLEVRTEGDVDRLNDLFARSGRRADIANGLLLGGAGASTLGVATLLWDYLRPRTDERVSVRVAPARAGVAIALRTSWRGGL